MKKIITLSIFISILTNPHHSFSMLRLLKKKIPSSSVGYKQYGSPIIPKEKQQELSLTLIEENKKLYDFECRNEELLYVLTEQNKVLKKIVSWNNTILTAMQEDIEPHYRTFHELEKKILKKE